MEERRLSWKIPGVGIWGQLFRGLVEVARHPLLLQELEGARYIVAGVGSAVCEVDGLHVGALVDVHIEFPVVVVRLVRRVGDPYLALVDGLIGRISGRAA